MQAKPVTAFPTPCKAPNGLQWTSEGLWVVDQILDDAYLLSETGKVLRKLSTVCENASGVTIGGDFLWMASNGTTVARPHRATDTHKSAVLKIDPASGKCIDRYPTPDGGGIHGIEWDGGNIWVTGFNPKSIYLVDPSGWKVLHSFPVDMQRLHGLARDGEGIWCAHTTDKVIRLYHAESGKILDQIDMPKNGPAPHGLSIRNGVLWYCDANFAGKNNAATRTEGPDVGRLELTGSGR